MRTHAPSNISYRKYFAVLIIQCRKYFVIFNFVVFSDCENISTMKISGFTVYTYIYIHILYIACIIAVPFMWGSLRLAPIIIYVQNLQMS